MLSEQILGRQSALPTMLERMAYRREYGDLIGGLQRAGRQGITFEQAALLYPGLSRNPDVLFTILGRVSGAMSNRWWSVQEVGAWLVTLNRGGRYGAEIVINVGPRFRTWFGFGKGTGTLGAPRSVADTLAHLGHTHPQFGILDLSRGDLSFLRPLFTDPTYQRFQLGRVILAGPTGQWRYLFSPFGP